jgi:tetratricopeptide (TPR) repeat protein
VFPISEDQLQTESVNFAFDIRSNGIFDRANKRVAGPNPAKLLALLIAELALRPNGSGMTAKQMRDKLERGPRRLISHGVPNPVEPFRLSEIVNFVEVINSLLGADVISRRPNERTSQLPDTKAIGGANRRSALREIFYLSLNKTSLAKITLNGGPVSAARFESAFKVSTAAVPELDFVRAMSIFKNDELYTFLFLLAQEKSTLRMRSSGLDEAYALSTFHPKQISEAISSIMQVVFKQLKEDHKSEQEVNEVALALLETTLNDYVGNLQKISDVGEKGLSRSEAEYLLKTAISMRAQNADLLVELHLGGQKANGVDSPRRSKIEMPPLKTPLSFGVHMNLAKLYRRAGFVTKARERLESIEAALPLLATDRSYNRVLSNISLEKSWLSYIMGTPAEYRNLKLALEKLKQELGTEVNHDALILMEYHTLQGLALRREIEGEDIGSTPPSQALQDKAIESIVQFSLSRDIGIYSADYDSLVDCLSAAGDSVYELGKRGLLESINTFSPYSGRKHWAIEAIKILSAAHYLQRILASASDRLFALIYVTDIVCDAGLEDDDLKFMTFRGRTVTLERLRGEVERLISEIDQPKAEDPFLPGEEVSKPFVTTQANRLRRVYIELICTLNVRQSGSRNHDIPCEALKQYRLLRENISSFQDTGARFVKYVELLADKWKLDEAIKNSE